MLKKQIMVKVEDQEEVQCCMMYLAMVETALLKERKKSVLFLITCYFIFPGYRNGSGSFRGNRGGRNEQRGGRAVVPNAVVEIAMQKMEVDAEDDANGIMNQHVDDAQSEGSRRGRYRSRHERNVYNR